MMTNVQAPSGSPLPGMAAGAIIGTGVAVATARKLMFPAPVAITAGALVGGPIAAISYMNNHGGSNSLLQSTLVGAAPFALAGTALGLFGSGWGAGRGVIATGAVMGTIVGGALGAVTHALTKPD